MKTAGFSIHDFHSRILDTSSFRCGLVTSGLAFRIAAAFHGSNDAAPGKRIAIDFFFRPRSIRDLERERRTRVHVCAWNPLQKDEFRLLSLFDEARDRSRLSANFSALAAGLDLHFANGLRLRGDWGYYGVGNGGLIYRAMKDKLQDASSNMKKPSLSAGSITGVPSVVPRRDKQAD